MNSGADKNLVAVGLSSRNIEILLKTNQGYAKDIQPEFVVMRKDFEVLKRRISLKRSGVNPILGF